MFYLAGSVSKPEIFHFRAEILHCNLTVRKVENANELLKWKFEGGWTGTAGDKLLGLSSSFLDWESATPLRWGRSTIGLNWFEIEWRNLQSRLPNFCNMASSKTQHVSGTTNQLLSDKDFIDHLQLKFPVFSYPTLGTLTIQRIFVFSANRSGLCCIGIVVQVIHSGSCVGN